MRHTIYIIRYMMAVLAVAMFTACDSDVHKDEHGVSLALSWQDANDSGSAINDIKLWIYDKSGSLVGEYHYNTTAEMASQRLELAQGEYTAVVGVNVTNPFSTENTTNSGTLTFSLPNGNSNGTSAYYSTTTFTCDGTGTQTIVADLARSLSELTVVIEGAPEGAVLTAVVNNASTGILPAMKDTEGNYGVATNNVTTVTLPTATTVNGTITTETIHLTPTVSGDNSSILHFTLKLTDGTVREFDAEAPKMKPSGKYILTLKYNEMKNYMYITAIRIDDWTEGWVIGGEILNPD